MVDRVVGAGGAVMTAAVVLAAEAGADSEIEVEMAAEDVKTELDIAEVVITLETAVEETALEAVVKDVEEGATSEAELFSQIRISHRNVVWIACVALTRERQPRRNMLACEPSCC